MATKVLVDSSIWIAAQDRKSACFWELSRLLRSAKDEVLTSELIRLEVSQGAKNEQIQTLLWQGFEGLKFLELNAAVYRSASSNYLRCRKNGITPTTIDCLLATLARENGVALWSLDQNLKRMAKVIGFDVHKVK